MMPATRPNKTLIIANPEAHSGQAGAVAERLQRFLALYHHDAAAYDLVYTERPRHAEELARDARNYATVMALGGDGVIHEVACGLMDHPAATRPALGIIPVGSGNDYARTLGITEDMRDDFSRLLTAEPTPMDVGRVRIYDRPVTSGDDAEGEACADSGAPLACTYFVETFSFGVDAAIALGTQQLRKTTPLTGDALYLASGFDVFGAHYRDYPARVSWDGDAPRELCPYLMALQIGPTYGSGFKVCPEADPADGLIDVCYACAPLMRVVTLPLFLRARNGSHVTSGHINLKRVRQVALDLAESDYPIQADGERIEGAHLVVDIIPHALTVLKPRG